MIDFSRLVSLPYWINKNPFTISQEFLSGWLIITTLLLVAGIVVRIWASRNNEIATQWVSWYYRISRLLVTTAILSYILAWFRYERITLFSARAWMLALLIVAVVWAIMIWRQRNSIKEAIQKRQLIQKLEKFLPKKKK